MPKGYDQLSKYQTCKIFSLNGTWKSQKEIARAIGVDQSSISRELCRNKFELIYEYNSSDKESSRKNIPELHVAWILAEGSR